MRQAIGTKNSSCHPPAHPAHAAFATRSGPQPKDYVLAHPPVGPSCARTWARAPMGARAPMHTHLPNYCLYAARGSPEVSPKRCRRGICSTATCGGVHQMQSSCSVSGGGEGGARGKGVLIAPFVLDMCSTRSLNTASTQLPYPLLLLLTRQRPHSALYNPSHYLPHITFVCTPTTALTTCTYTHHNPSLTHTF